MERALAVVGPRWTLLIVRHLLEGPRRYTEIERALGRANPKMITVRLRELESAGLVTRTSFPEIPPRVEYALTERGRALGPVIEALRAWGIGAQRKGRRRRTRSGIRVADWRRRRAK